MRSVSNPTRGCGHLVPGGCYLGGAFSPNGTLAAWSWLLGQHLTHAFNLFATVPARQLQIINLPYTLGTGRPVYDPDATPEMIVPDEVKARLLKLPKLALLDHVGTAHYSAYKFADECERLGPSRRVPRAIAAQIAPHLPIPIIFTHSILPVVDAENVPQLTAWANEINWVWTKIERPEREYSTDPTFYHPKWGMRWNSDIGNDHWLPPVLKAWETNDAPEPLQRAITAEQIFGASWITRATYVTRGDESQEDLAELEEAGIQPVTADAPMVAGEEGE